MAYLQTAVGHYYSDGYLRSDSIAQHHPIIVMTKSYRLLFSNKHKVAGQENDKYVYDRPTYDGVVSSAGYDRLKFSKDVRNLANGSRCVQNSIYPSNVQFENLNRHPKLAVCSSMRWTI